MNNERRKQIEAARALVESAFDKLEEARSMIDDIKADEESAFENLPEALQTSDRGERMQDAISALEDAENNVESLDFEAIFSSLEEAGQ